MHLHLLNNKVETHKTMKCFTYKISTNTWGWDFGEKRKNIHLCPLAIYECTTSNTHSQHGPIDRN